MEEAIEPDALAPDVVPGAVAPPPEVPPAVLPVVAVLAAAPGLAPLALDAAPAVDAPWLGAVPDPASVPVISTRWPPCAERSCDPGSRI